LGQRLGRWLADLCLQGSEDGPTRPDSAPRALHRSAASEVPPPLARARSTVEVQAEALELLRRRAHTDPVTGLPNRRHLLGRLRGVLAEPGAAGAGLLILRVLDFEGRREGLGRDGAAHVLGAVADVLMAYPQRVVGSFAGRLNVSDFALYLPVRGLADETAQTLMRALRASPVATAAGVEMVVGGIDGLCGDSVAGALAAADHALAQAEAAGPFCAEVHLAGGPDSLPLGERSWRVRLDEALSENRACLGEFAVRNCTGVLLHLECPLRVQLEIGGPFREARHWLPMASRSRLLPRADLVALDLALTAITRDALPRCVHVSTASLATPGFVGDVQRRLLTEPDASSKLWIEVADGSTLERALPRLREAGAAWRRHGVRLGVEHAGASMSSLARLGECGLDHLKVEARFVRGLHHDAEVRSFAAGLLALAHMLGMRVIAEGVDSTQDLDALWALGFDGATGPAVS
jgi:EAL domain-containing protein (putative c-di-GMP-specific phosphodiesterase class I)/GGDEF domain-containing protein